MGTRLIFPIAPFAGQCSLVLCGLLCRLASWQRSPFRRGTKFNAAQPLQSCSPNLQPRSINADQDRLRKIPQMRVRIADGPVACALLIGLTLWGLLMIVPDLYRVVDPLGSVGLAADNDGRIYDVRGPFDRDADSPAWTAGLRVGDRIDLEAMRCLPPSGAACTDLLSVVGGMGGVQLVRPGRVLALRVRPATDG